MGGFLLFLSDSKLDRREKLPVINEVSSSGGIWVGGDNFLLHTTLLVTSLCREIPMWM